MCFVSRCPRVKKEHKPTPCSSGCPENMDSMPPPLFLALRVARQSTVSFFIISDAEGAPKSTLMEAFVGFSSSICKLPPVQPLCLCDITIIIQGSCGAHSVFARDHAATATSVDKWEVQIKARGHCTLRVLMDAFGEVAKDTINFYSQLTRPGTIEMLGVGSINDSFSWLLCRTP